MTEPLVLTTAEVGFLLSATPPALPSLRQALRLPETDARTEAAGLASLAARGLCAQVGGDLVVVPAIGAVLAALAEADRVTRMLGWDGDDPVVAHLVTGPSAHLGLSPLGDGRYAVRPLEPGTPLGEQAARFLDRHLAGARRSALLVRTATARGEASLAVAVDEHGEWTQSESLTGETRTGPSSRDLAVARLAELVAR